MVAIDFTASNLSPADPNSLHYNPRNPDRMPNEYERAIKAIGSILSNYDSNWRYPCYGFGGVPTWTGQLSHAFALSGQEHAPAVMGVDGILSVY